MSTAQQPNPGQDPGPGKKQNDPNKQGDDGKTNPGKPGSDPDQTPEREVKQPPVAEPDKSEKPNKIGFSDQFLLF